VRRALLLVLALLGPIQSLDDRVAATVQAGRRPALEAPMSALTKLARPVTVLSGLLAVALLDGAAGVPTVRGCIAVLIPVNVVVETLKWCVHRTRPDGDTRRANSSFPSSHAANALALAWMLSRRWPRLRIPFMTLALLVCYSRMYLHRHYLSDVLVGAALGLVIAVLVCRLWPALDPAARRKMPEPRLPGG
jgi:membrane-associated phospholipid phosphatase